MKRFVFAVGVLALGFAASTPARADFTVVKFESGFCRIWRNNSANPMGTGWSRIATAPDFMGAWAAQDAAVKKSKCKSKPHRARVLPPRRRFALLHSSRPI